MKHFFCKLNRFESYFKTKQSKQAGPIAERSNSLVRGRGDPGSNPREVFFSGMTN